MANSQPCSLTIMATKRTLQLWLWHPIVNHAHSQSWLQREHYNHGYGHPIVNHAHSQSWQHSLEHDNYGYGHPIVNQAHSQSWQQREHYNYGSGHLIFNNGQLFLSCRFQSFSLLKSLSSNFILSFFFVFRISLSSRYCLFLFDFYFSF